jgi:hypothetical protein
MQTEKEPGSWFPWLIVAVMGYILWTAKKEDVPAPEPTPTKPRIETVVKTMMSETHKGYATVFNEAAKRVEAKEIANEEQLFSEIQKGLGDARRKAAVELDRIIDDAIPTEFDDGNRGAVATFLRQLGGAW